MGFLAASSVEWYLPFSYTVIVAVASSVTLLKRRNRHQLFDKGQQPAKSAVSEEGSLNVPLLSEEHRGRGEGREDADTVSRGPYAGDGGGGVVHRPRYSVTDPSVLWLLLVCCLLQTGYHTINTIVLMVRAHHLTLHSVFEEGRIVTNLFLAMTWGLLGVVVNLDFWSKAHPLSPVKSTGGWTKEGERVGRIMKRKMWWLLWPSFNLILITSLSTFLRDTPSLWSRSFTLWMHDDKFWSLLVTILAWIGAGFAAAVGSSVIPCHEYPNEEFTCGLVNATLFGWFSKYIDLAQTKQLDLDDVPVLVDSDTAAYTWKKFKSMSGKSGLARLCSILCCCCRLRRKGRQGGATNDANKGSINTHHEEEGKEEEEEEEPKESSKQPKKKVPLLWKLYRLVRPMFYVQALCQILAIVLEFVPSLALQNIVNFLQNYRPSSAGGGGGGGGGGISSATVFWVVLLFVGPVAQGICDGRQFHLGRRIGCRVRAALVGSVFRKMLRMDMARADFNAGELTNLMSVDAQMVLDYSSYVHFIWTTLLQVFATVGLLFYVLGPSAAGGVLFMLLSVPLGKWTTSKTHTFQKALMKHKDARMSIVSEVMQGIRIIKLFAWEDSFRERIRKARLTEMKSLRQFMIMLAGVQVQWNSTTTLVGLCTFIFHTRVLGKTLTASQGFTALSLFGILNFPLVVLPDVVNFYLAARVSLTRIEEFLARGELEGLAANGDEDFAQQEEAYGNGSGNGKAYFGGEGGLAGGAGLLPGSIRVVDGCFQWHKAAKKEEEGGQEGNKKEEEELAELEKREDDDDDDDGSDDADTKPLIVSSSNSNSSTGTSIASGANSEASGSEWGDNGPTLSAINFEVRPGQLVCVYGPTGCGKSSLLMALLGEIPRLSGQVAMAGTVAYCGQKAWMLNATVKDNILFGTPMDEQRYLSCISACALQSDLDLLEGGDMCEIGEKGINLSGGQQQRISLARALYADADVYLLDDVLSAVDAHVGEEIFRRCIRQELVGRGKTVVLVSHQIPMTARVADMVVVMHTDGTFSEVDHPKDLLSDSGSRLYELVDKTGGRERIMRQKSDEHLLGEGEGEGKDDQKLGSPDVTTKKQPPKEAQQLVKAEERARGSAGLRVYISYCKACGGLGAFLVPFLLLLASYNGLQFAQNLLLTKWVDKLESGEDDTFWMWLYIAISLGLLAAIFTRCVFQSFASLRASVSIHDRMTDRVLRAPLSWFETTPLGRIFNRFSSDIYEIDKDLMEAFSSVLSAVFTAVSVVVVVSYTIPWLIIFLIPISALGYWIGVRYLNCSRELKRLDSVSKSPMYAHFTESVMGVQTIRAYRAQDRFIQESCKRVDACSRAHLYLWVSNRWFNLRIQIVGAFVGVLAGAFLVWWGKDNVEPAVAGLSLLYALQFTNSLKFVVRQQAQLEMQMNSVERTDEYLNVPQEKPFASSNPPPPTWPSQGKIEVKGLSLQYASMSTPVLKNMSFTVGARTRVGIVGRTGAGKSSLTSALFRLVEPSAGSVVIDGVNALEIGLAELRSKLSIVPQDPVLFRGTVRSNLDPFNDFTDVVIWHSLERAHLSTAIQQQGGLDAPVQDSGSNFSVGQRQLLCMARAMLRDSSILVMDEATANVDPETDLLIQETVRHEFRNKTVLSIAHRLHTVIFMDKVMVLDKGELIEYDSPSALLRDEDSLFFGLCSKSGALDELRATALQEEELAGLTKQQLVV